MTSKREIIVNGEAMSLDKFEMATGLHVDGNLNLTGCTELTSLPEGLTVRRGLYLPGCKALTALPDGLTVGGDINLTGCTALTSLPEGLTVKGELCLTGCSVRNVGRGGKDQRGYEFFAIRCATGIRIIAGCRNFSPDEAEAHWASRPKQLMLARRALQHLEEIEARG
jgi:hypothetical protein